MRSGMTPAFTAALEQSVIYPAIYVKAVFADGPVHLWSGYGPSTWAGNMYTGAGALLGISNSTETTDVQAQGLTVTLSGIDPGLIGSAVDYFLPIAPITVSLALFDPATRLMIPDPVTLFEGFMDSPEITVGSDTCSIAVACENRLLELSIAPSEWRYTNDVQQRLYPLDFGLTYVNAIANIPLYWGSSTNGSNTGAP